MVVARGMDPNATRLLSLCRDRINIITWYSLHGWQ